MRQVIENRAVENVFPLCPRYPRGTETNCSGSESIIPTGNPSDSPAIGPLKVSASWKWWLVLDLPSAGARKPCVRGEKRVILLWIA